MSAATPKGREVGPTGGMERLRHDIDHGRTGDKVDWPDPAAAPLGTDDEAAGTPPPTRAIEHDRAAQRARPSHAPQRRGGIGAAWILIVIVAVAVVGTAVWLASLAS